MDYKHRSRGFCDNSSNKDEEKDLKKKKNGNGNSSRVSS